ncbi:MAG: ABC transporter permease, partial [Vicinamibacterales bacterium]
MPNRVLVSLLRWLSSRDAANAAVGDALEELAERTAAGRPPLLSTVWINLQIGRAIGMELRAAGPRLLRSIGTILRDATRALRAAPGHSLFVVLVLAIGATLATLTFSVVDAVMLKPLPVDHPEELVNISTTTIHDQPLRGRAVIKRFITPDVFWRIHDSLHSVQAIAARSNWTGEMITVGRVRFEGTITNGTADLFTLLRLSPSIGRLWTVDEGARGEHVAVLGYRFWRDQLGGDPSILGKTVSDAGSHRTYTVVGVLSAASDHPGVDLTTSEVWVPIVLPHTSSDEHYHFGIIARLRPGVSPPQVADEVARITGAPDWKPDVTPLLDGYVASFRRWMLLALGAAALVMLVACANAANLMLTRSVARTQEMAVRASLGASRRQIAMSVLAEGLLLSAGATVAALLFSVVGARVAKAAVIRAVPWMFRASTIDVDGRVLAAAIAAAALTGVLFSIVPAWQTSRTSVSVLLKDSGGPSSTRRRGWRSAFLVAEVATVVVLLTVSWLFVASLIRVDSVDLGIDTHRLIAINPRFAFRTSVDDVQQRAARVPGVLDVAVSTGASTPLVGQAFSGAWGTSQVQRTDIPGAPIDVLHYNVTRNYFQVAGIRFLRGGTWRSDTADASSAIVLDEQAVRQLFGTDEALGRPVRAIDLDGGSQTGLFTIVGIVQHVYVRGPEEVDPPSAFFPLAPKAARKFADLLLKTSGPPEDVLPAVNEALRTAAPDLTEPFVFAADQSMPRITALRRFNAEIMLLFGVVGMLIGAAGVYAVMMSFVAQQTREIGVRVALGASPTRIQRGVLALASRHLMAGLAIGVPIAWW